MTLVDIIIAAVVALGLFRGVTTGAVRQVTGLVGVVAAFALAVQLMRSVGRLAVDSLGISEAAAPVVGFVLVFIAVQLVFYLLGRLVERVMEALALSVVNRVVGGAFGAFQAALLLSVAFMLLGRVDVPDKHAQEASILYEPVAQVLPRTWDYAADHVNTFKSLSEQFGDRIQSEIPASAQE